MDGEGSFGPRGLFMTIRSRCHEVAGMIERVSVLLLL